ncbi:MAG: hypothetical protein ACFFDY_00465 [Candidatus Thorarchaeota archaeon]
MAELTTKRRKALPKRAFAIIEYYTVGGKRKWRGHYPIYDKAHAVNALARVDQHGSSSEKAKVRAAVKAKYPGLPYFKKKSKK